MELFTVQETARMLKVSPLTVRRYIADGRLPAVKVGRSVRVRKEVLDQFIKPIEPKARKGRSAARGRPTSAEDPIWNIVGIARSGGPGDVAENKYKYLAEAYAAEFE
jgi:excisionase family DNA binding protein